MEQNHTISSSELLRIISSYANAGASSSDLANLYDLLFIHTPIYKEKEKEERSKEEKEIEKKILTIISGKKDKTRNITEDLRRFIDSISGDFSTGQLYQELCITSKEDKDIIRKQLSNEVKRGTIDSLGRKSGTYRKVDVRYSVYKIDGNTVEKPLPIQLPLNIHSLGEICGGDILSVWGEKSTGKSAFGLYSSWLNKDLFPGHTVRYIQNGELKRRRATKRLLKMPQDVYPWQTWNKKVDFIDPEGCHWSDIVDPDGFNVIDYIERLTDAFLIPEDISRIQAKMDKGVALIMVQKDPTKTFGAGGAQLKNKPTLIVSLQRGDRHNEARIIDIKDYDDDKVYAQYGVRNPAGLWMPYHLVKGWKFIPRSDKWLTKEEKSFNEKKYARYEDDVFVREEGTFESSMAQ